MTSRLPLFPLGTVLVPGMVLPLHVFEERYRVLVQDLLDSPPAEREFGVVAIQAGREVGADGVVALHAVGCTAQVRAVRPREDGRYDVVTTGAERFRLHDVDHSRPYLVGQVEPLTERADDAAACEVLGAAVHGAFVDYLRALAATGDVEPDLPELPRDPRTLSYLVAAATRVDLDRRQALLEVPDDDTRLRSGLALLRREVRLLAALSAVPAPELAHQPLSPN